MNDNQIYNIRYFKDIKETLYPEEQLTEDKEYLKGFLWHIDIKPQRKDF